MKLFGLTFSALLASSAFALPTSHLGDVEQPFTFLSIGDWGFPGPSQSDLADQMAQRASVEKPNFIISLGDNFYQDGVHSDSDPLFKTVFEDVYSSPSLHVPWYIIAGNHDHYGNITGQITYSALSKRWNFPSLYWSREFEIDEKGTKLQIVAIDTETMVEPANRISVYRDEMLDANESHLREQMAHGKEGYEGKVMRESTNGVYDTTRMDQLNWINQTLATSTADWLVVIGHHPVYSSGSHGNTQFLLDNVNPLLKKYGVHAYFCGHDHNIQHLKDEGLHYIVNGSGGKLNDSWAPVPQEVYYSQTNMFAVHRISSGMLVTDFVDIAGHVHYSFTIPFTPRPTTQSALSHSA